MVGQQFGKAQRPGRQRLAGAAGHRGGGGLEVGHEPVEPLLVLGAGETRQVGIAGGDHRTAMTKVDLELPEVLTLLEQMGCVRMPQHLPILHIRSHRAESNTGITRATVTK